MTRGYERVAKRWAALAYREATEAFFLMRSRRPSGARPCPAEAENRRPPRRPSSTPSGSGNDCS